MKLDAYQIEAAKTAVYPQEHKYAYPALGVCEEIGEFCEKLLDRRRDPVDLRDELGDIMWYTAACARDFGLTLSECYDSVTAVGGIADFGMAFAGMRLAGRVKKILRGDSLDGKIDQIRKELGKIIHCVDAVASNDAINATMSEVFQANLDKLFDRKARGVIKGDGDRR